MPKITKEKKFNYWFGRASAQNAIDGWDEEKIMSLPEKEREWLLQFLIEYSGQANKPIISQKITREGWVKKRHFYLDAQYISVPLMDEDTHPLTHPVTESEINDNEKIKNKKNIKRRAAPHSNGLDPKL